MGRLRLQQPAAELLRSTRPGSLPLPLPLSSTTLGPAATMASSEEDGTNGGAPDAGEEREAAGKRRRLSLLATVWLTFYNIAMTAGYVRPGGLSAPGCPHAAAPRHSASGRWRGGGGCARGRGGGAPARALNGAGRGAGPARSALPNTVHGGARWPRGAGGRLSIDPGRNAGPPGAAARCSFCGRNARPATLGPGAQADARTCYSAACPESVFFMPHSFPNC